MDWTGNKNSTFTCLGASNHSDYEREKDDYYATEPIAAELLLEVEPELNNIWECACGEGHLAKVFDKYGKLGKASDLVNRGYGTQEGFFFGNTEYGQDYFDDLQHTVDVLSDVKEGEEYYYHSSW